MIDALLRPADALRARLLKPLSPLVRPFVVQRELRVMALGLILVLFALVGTLVVPFWMLALGPVVWGVPHVLSDVRYLVVRPGHHRRARLALGVGLPIAAAGLGGGVAAGFVAIAAVFVLVRCPWWKRVLGLCFAATGFGLSLWQGYLADLVFAHGHNFIGVALWWLWRPRQSRQHLAPLLLFVALSVALALGAFDPVFAEVAAYVPSPLTLDGAYFLRTLAPPDAGALGFRLVLLYAFAQSVHYAIWIRLVPEEARPQRTPRSFRATFRALEADFGRWLLLATLVAALAVVVWAVIDLAQARLGYLRLASFHGHLELAALALLFARGRSAASSREGNLARP